MNTLHTTPRTAILAILIFAQAFQSSIGADMPQAVQSLVEKRKDAISRIDKTFIQELEKIKINYAKIGDLETANLVLALIKQTKDSDADASISLYGDQRFIGVWILNAPGGWTDKRTLNADHSIVEQNGGKWRIDESKLILEMRDGAVDQFVIPRTGNKLSGSNQNKQVLTLTKTK